MWKRRIGRRRSDYLRPIIVAVIGALVTNGVQGALTYTYDRDVAAYWYNYAAGLERCLRPLPH